MTQKVVFLAFNLKSFPDCRKPGLLFLFFVSCEHGLYMSHSSWAQRGQINVNEEERCEDKGDDDMDDIHENKASQHADYCRESLYVPKQYSCYYLKRQ